MVVETVYSQGAEKDYWPNDQAGGGGGGVIM